jgi:uncharacterized protein YkwD
VKKLAFAIMFLFFVLNICPAIASSKKGGSSIRLEMATADQLNADPANSLDLDQARQYMLELINRDRASCGIGPVQLDETASKAAQLHADEMASLQFNSHWHPDGRKPPERYNDVGGTDCVMENSAGCPPSLKGFTASVPKNPKFSKDEIKWVENMFFDEKPPNDGHRRNILNPERTHVGVGITIVNVMTSQNGQTFAGRIPASAQEFINRLGVYTAAVRELKKGRGFIVSGEMKPGYQADCINVRREDLPKDIPLNELRGDASSSPYRDGYCLSDEVVLNCFPGNQSSEAKLDVDGEKFQYEITPSQTWKPGLYYFLLWAHGSDNKHVQASLLTARLVDR